MSVNCCNFVGRLATDVEYNENNLEVPVARFRVAVRRPAPKEGEPDADFIQVVAFRGQARFIHTYFKKGDYIALVCRYRARSYQAADGQTRYAHEFVVQEAHFSSGPNGKGNGGSADAGQPAASQAQPPRRAAPPAQVQPAPAVEVPF
jgi:single-strand DNA-binding protein